ncbi:MAG: glycosyltransferase [Verrucomicrobiota bacterium]
MRLLAVYPYVPYPLDRGAHYRGFYLLRELARVHEVDLVALAEHGVGMEYQDVFARFCRQVHILPFQHPPWERLFPQRLLAPSPATIRHWRSARLAAALAEKVDPADYQALHLFDIVLAQYFLDGAWARLPLVLDRTRVDLQYQLMEARRCPRLKAGLLAVENMAKLWAFERRVAARARLQIVCGDDDERFLRRFIRKTLPIAVIPNGVDIECFCPEPARDASRAARPTILFCGAMDYVPNVDALEWYFATMHQLLSRTIPELGVWIVGKNPGPGIRAYSERRNVTVTGSVDDVRPFYRQAWLQFVPLRIGGGTRLKIVECMAMGTAVVSTTIGAQGLGLQHDQDLLLADSPVAFVAETERILRQPDLRRRLEAKALDTVRRTLAWPVLGKRLAETYAQTFAPGRVAELAAADVRPV